MKNLAVPYAFFIGFSKEKALGLKPKESSSSDQVRVGRAIYLAAYFTGRNGISGHCG